MVNLHCDSALFCLSACCSRSFCSSGCQKSTMFACCLGPCPRLCWMTSDLSSLDCSGKHIANTAPGSLGCALLCCEAGTASGDDAERRPRSWHQAEPSLVQMIPQCSSFVSRPNLIGLTSLFSKEIHPIKLYYPRPFRLPEQYFYRFEQEPETSVSC